jgi:hypothetical protein
MTWILLSLGIIFSIYNSVNYLNTGCCLLPGPGYVCGHDGSFCLIGQILLGIYWSSILFLKSSEYLKRRSKKVEQKKP